jgi:hypothetical protein
LLLAHKHNEKTRSNKKTHHRIRRLVAATRFPLATAEKSIWYTGKRNALAGDPDMLAVGLVYLLLLMTTKWRNPNETTTFPLSREYCPIT